MSDDEIRQLLVIEAAARGAQTVSDEVYQRMLSHARHNLRPLCEEVLRLQAERDALARFKKWVHDYLDGKGVPHHPPGVHGAEGCRIGDRMDHVWAELEPFRQLAEWMTSFPAVELGEVQLMPHADGEITVRLGVHPVSTSREGHGYTLSAAVADALKGATRDE